MEQLKGKNMPTEILLVSGAAISIIFEWFPWVSQKYNTLSEEWKKAVMAVVLFLATAGILGAACLGKSDVVACNQAGIWDALGAYVIVLAGNQATHLLTKKSG